MDQPGIHFLARSAFPCQKNRYVSFGDLRNHGVQRLHDRTIAVDKIDVHQLFRAVFWCRRHSPSKVCEQLSYQEAQTTLRTSTYSKIFVINNLIASSWLV